MSLLESSFYGNSLKAWFTAVVIIVVAAFLMHVLKELVAHRLMALAKKTKSGFDDILAELLEKTNFLFLLLVSIYLGSLFLELSAGINNLIMTIAAIGVILQSAIWGNSFITAYGAEYTKKKSQAEGTGRAATLSALVFCAKLLLWSLTALIIMDNLGIDVTALVAGLGVGGIAVALAVQNVLGDLFASLAIVLDKPFVIGDFIIVGDYMGCVERVGLKTTHVRSLSGEQVIFSNTDLLNSRIRNYKRMEERRIVFPLGVTYETTKEKLEAISDIIKDAVNAEELTRFDRSHFKEYGDFALLFETVYYVLSSDYNVYMDIQQAINFTIFSRFNDEGIEFAYPTQTLYINKETI